MTVVLVVLMLYENWLDFIFKDGLVSTTGQFK